MAAIHAGLIPSTSNNLLPAHKAGNFPPKFKFEYSSSKRHNSTLAVLSTQVNSSAQSATISENPIEHSNTSLLDVFDRTHNFPYDCKQIHAYFTKSGLVGLDTLVKSKLAMFYLKRKGFLDDARKLFDEMPVRTLPLYAALITTYSKSGRWVELFSVLQLMVQDGMLPNKYLIPTILKACSAVEFVRSGKMVHAYVIRHNLTTDIFVGNALIELYANCDKLGYSRSVFDVMQDRDVVSWTSLVSAYMSAGRFNEAKEIFDLMQSNGVKPDLISWNALVSGFAQNGEIQLAILSFEEMQETGLKPRVNSWNGLVSGCVQNGYFEDALAVFEEMLQSLQNPNVVTIVSILPACAALKVLELGKAVHSYAIKSDLYKDIHVNGSLIDMYSKCGKIDDAEKVFFKIESKNTTVWNEMISAYVSDGKMEAKLNLLESMKNNGIKPDAITYNTLLTGYSRNGEKNKAYALLSDLIHMDLKLSIVSFNALISGFQQSGLTHEALKLFGIMQMPAKNGIIDESLLVPTQPNTVTVAAALAACADLNLLCMGKEIHGYIVKKILEPNVFVSSALVDMYAKCHNISSGIKIFQRFEDKNTVLWNSLIAGYIYNSQPEDAFKLFDEMLRQGAEPSSITLMILILACGEVGALRVGKQLHSYLVKQDELNEQNGKLSSTLTEMYAKCGCIYDAKLVFESIVNKDLCNWNSMICAYSTQRMADEAILLFERMETLGIVPDKKTFSALLTACKKEDLVNEGRNFFDMMVKYYGVSAGLEDYKCMVDIMVDGGLLDEALDLIQRMPHVADASIWTSLLEASRLHINTAIEERAANELIRIERKQG